MNGFRKRLRVRTGEHGGLFGFRGENSEKLGESEGTNTPAPGSGNIF